MPHTHALPALKPFALLPALSGMLLGHGAANAQQTEPAVAPVVAEFPVVLASEALLPQLRKGGWVLYMRHGNTDNSTPDQPDLNLRDCNTQRPSMPTDVQ